MYEYNGIPTSMNHVTVSPKTNRSVSFSTAPYHASRSRLGAIIATSPHTFVPTEFLVILMIWGAFITPRTLLDEPLFVPAGTVTFRMFLDFVKTRFLFLYKPST